ncbi:hypothetical protein FA15DRAFT_659129 [Coprinopsis marcescibilis]|uniref:VPS37 C-terminal domain-containing protein n=1 Tax=Coprinopsis marcescibilis TaxID=230819 RepID=A0A5C3KJX8_COPMA|nr:hypothetical protein FA15DRAFT_659129 [Coprinopsis marcescibilis]
MATALLAEFPELANLSREDLEDLLEDQTYFQAIFHSLQRVKDLYNQQAELGLANETIAKNNLELEQPLYKLREETQAAFDEARALESRWKDLDKEQKEVYQRFTPQFLLMRLKHSITAQDDASEALASSFVQQLPSLPSLDNNGEHGRSQANRSGQEVEDFVKEFKEARKIYHKRALWAEKWGQGNGDRATRTCPGTHVRANKVEHGHQVASCLLERKVRNVCSIRLACGQVQNRGGNTTRDSMVPPTQ